MDSRDAGIKPVVTAFFSWDQSERGVPNSQTADDTFSWRLVARPKNKYYRMQRI